MVLHYTKQDKIARIELDNPPVNVFTPALHKEFLEILKDFIADDNVHVGLWTAAGNRAFCAGDDIKTERPERSTAEMVARELGVRHEGESLEYPGWEVEIQGLTRFKPMVSAINGYCLGQGFIYNLPTSRAIGPRHQMESGKTHNTPREKTPFTGSIVA